MTPTIPGTEVRLRFQSRYRAGRRKPNLLVHAAVSRPKRETKREGRRRGGIDSIRFDSIRFDSNTI
jgi:hypothetical protein